MRVRIALALPLLAAVGMNAVAWSSATAQNALAPIPKPSERSRGTREGWDPPKDQKEKPAAKAPQPKKPGPVASAKKDKPATPARDKEDGGLPLPRSQTDDDRAPVGFDSKGNMGTSLRF